MKTTTLSTEPAAFVNVVVQGGDTEASAQKTFAEPPPPFVHLVPEPSPQARLATVKAASNPLLEAAQPLLRALADMPAELDPEAIDVLHRLLEREVTTFQSICSSAQIKHEHVVAASYALCTAIDEAANTTTWGGGADHVPHREAEVQNDSAPTAGHVGIWAGQQLAAHFHGDTKGGDKFFLLVGRLAAHPQEHLDLLEVLYIILGLGFEGRFSTGSQGRRQLDTIRHQLLALLNAGRGDVPRDLSPHWKGVATGRFRLLRGVPVWFTAVLLLLASLGIFVWFSHQLQVQRTGVEERIRAIGALQPPAVPPHKPLRLKELLGAEIARGTVSVEEDAARSAVSFKGDDMFVPGQARMNQRILPVIAKVAGEINEVSGTVQVTGHSDNLPIKTREFPDNHVLSKKRAEAVASVLAERGVALSRLKVEGSGDTVPVASNATAAGRARNRRVDIVVTQGGQ